MCNVTLLLFSMYLSLRGHVWMYMAWIVHRFDKTDIYVWPDSFLGVTTRIHMSDMTYAYPWQDSFICVTWLTGMHHITYLYVCHDSFLLSINLSLVDSSILSIPPSLICWVCLSFFICLFEVSFLSTLSILNLNDMTLVHVTISIRACTFFLRSFFPLPSSFPCAWAWLYIYI